MDLQCRYKHASLIRPNRFTLPAGTWRDFLTLVCGLLLLIPASIGGQRQSYIPRLPDCPECKEQWQVEQPVSTPAVAYDDTGCDRLGWYPAEFGLKDHSVFLFNGIYYIVSIRTPDEKAFVYARSPDLCNWEDLGTVVDQRIRWEWDEAFVWAPFVLEEDGVFYMYYTGVRRNFTQSIMLATSTNPADPDSWQRQGMIFQPSHEGMLWQAGSWADCRDATVVKIGDIYFMYYAGRDVGGPIIGWATSFAPAGPWYDWGATLTLSRSDEMAESPTLVSRAGTFYLFYNNASKGEEYRIGQTQIGPWSDSFTLPSGWANEMWVGQNGLEYTSFLKGYEIVIERCLWDDSYSPPRLHVRAGTYSLFFPFLLNP